MTPQPAPLGHQLLTYFDIPHDFTMKSVFKDALRSAKDSLRRDESPHNYPPAVQGAIQDAAQQAPSTPSLPPRSPTPQDLLRYRYHHGTNLGSIFVLEKWLHGSMFDDGVKGDSELDAVTRSIKIRGVDATRAKWEAHWTSALSDQDLQWLVQTARCTTIRLPIGYFTLGAGFCRSTPFANQIAQVYANAWAFVKWLIERCYRCGIGILLDLHALPGGANGENHSGTCSGKPQLWKSSSNLELAHQCLTFMAREATTMPGVIGVQLCNEAMWDAPGMYKFYDNVIAAVTQIDPGLPIYISDAWNLGTALQYCSRKNSVKGPTSNPVIVDTHIYYCFAEKHTSQGPRQLIDLVTNELKEVDHYSHHVFEKKGAVAVFVGEYSCTLSGPTWSRVRDHERPQLTNVLGRTESQVWQQRSCGSTFWTLKMDWMPGGDWGFKENVSNGNITTPPNLALPAAEVVQRSDHAEQRKEELRQGAMQGHRTYWDGRDPGGQYEHWRYDQGWNLGWADARYFFRGKIDGTIPQMYGQDGGDKIGALDLWVLKRMREAGCADRSTCGFGWIWEQGFRRGVQDFYSCVGV